MKATFYKLQHCTSTLLRKSMLVSNILVVLYDLNTITRFYFCQIFFIIRLQDPPRHSFLCRIPCMKIMPFKICNSFKGIICISSKAYNFFSSQHKKETQQHYMYSTIMNNFKKNLKDRIFVIIALRTNNIQISTV